MFAVPLVTFVIALRLPVCSFRSLFGCSVCCFGSFVGSLFVVVSFSCLVLVLICYPTAVTFHVPFPFAVCLCLRSFYT